MRIAHAAPVLPLLAVALPLVLTTGCSDDAEARAAQQRIDEAWDATRNYTAEQIAEMNTKMQEQWSDLKVEIEKLKTEAAARGGAAKRRIDTVVEDLKQRAKDAGDRLDAAAQAGSASAKESVDHAAKSLAAAKAALAEAWQGLQAK